MSKVGDGQSTSPSAPLTLRASSPDPPPFLVGLKLEGVLGDEITSPAWDVERGGSLVQKRLSGGNLVQKSYR